MVNTGFRDGSQEEGAESAHGVSFETWAFVLSGLGDGLGLGELLMHLELDETRWSAADAAFQEQLLEDVERGGRLTEALDDAMREARKSWRRPIPPLDRDLRAWLDFYRAWALHESPMVFLHEMSLRASDIHRLQALWVDRLANDASLRAEAIAILAAPARPPQAPSPGPPRLIRESAPEAANAAVTAPMALHPVKASLPFVAGAAAPMHPPLSVPLPPPRELARRSGMEETSTRIGVIQAVLPFSAATMPGPASSAPDVATPTGAPDPILRAEGVEMPNLSNADASATALPIATASPVLSFLQPDPATASAPVQSAQASPDVTADIALTKLGPALPFVAAPRAGSPGPDETAIGYLPPARSVLPFQGGRAEKSEPPVDALIVDQTAPMGAHTAATPLPFSPASAAPPAGSRKTAPMAEGNATVEGSFTVERYAALCVEFVDVPDKREETLSKYGITPEQKAKLDAHWTQEMAKDPAMWLAWDRACTAHRVALWRKGPAT